MARFSRLRRSAALLLMTAGFGGLTAGATSAREIGDVIPPSTSSQLAVDSVKRGMIEARHRGFHALVQAASTQKFGHQPTMVNGKTLAQVIVKRQAAEEKSVLHRLFGGNQLSAAEVTSAAASRCSCDSANEAHLELLSRKFRAMEQIEAAALAHCREFAVNAHLLGSILTEISVVPQAIGGGNVAIALPTKVEVPTFAFTTVTTTVTVPDGGTVLIGARKFTQPASSRGMVAASDAAENASQLLSCIAEELTLNQALQRKINRAGECEVGIPVAGFPRCFRRVGRMELLSETYAEIAGIQASRHLMKAASPIPLVLHQIGIDGLERIGIDFDIVPQISITEDESPVADHAPFEAKVGPSSYFFDWSMNRSQASAASAIQDSTTTLQLAPMIQSHVGADGLERIGIDFDVAIQPESLAMPITPRIIITEEEEESLLGVVTEDSPPVPPAPRTLAAALMANAAKRGCQFHCVQISPADFIEVTAYRAVTGSHEALLEMPFSMEKLLTLQIEITPLLEEGSAGITGCFGPEKRETPVLRMSSLTQERMMRHLANMAAEEDDCPGFKCADANVPANAEYQFPSVNEWKQLSSNCKFGPALAEKPILRMPSRIPERLLRLLATKTEQHAELDDCPGFKCAEVPTPISETEYHFPEVTSWKQLQAKRTDAAPAENPEETGIEPYFEEFVQQLPPRGDAPLANPDYVTATPRVVSPTMSPLEYAETFLTMDERNNLPQGTELLLSDHQALTGRMIGIGGLGYEEDTIIRTINRFGNTVLQQQRDDQVKQTAHDEPAKACDNPLLRALGTPISVGPCESETCRGFTIQFAPCEKPAAVAEAQAFDGPAQILLQDCPGKLDKDYSLTAQPAHEESLDELAQRLEREFLRRAVSGQIQVPEACQNHAAPVCGTPFSKTECTAAVCPPGACQPGTCGTTTCPGCPVGSPCGVGIAPTQYGGPNVPMPLFGNNIVSNAGVCGNIVLDHGCLPAPATCGAATAPCLGVAPCCGATNPTSAAGCQCAECPKACGGECCCAKKDHVPVPAVTWNPYATEPATIPSCTVPAPQMAMVPPAASVPSRWVAPSINPAVTPIRPELHPVALETHREISRTLGQLAERCEAQGLYQQADALRAQATDFRTSARMIHGNLIEQGCMMGQMPGAQPVAWYPAPPMMPYPMPAPPTYAPEPMPTFGPPSSPVAPATYPQPLPIAQPMMVPRY